MSLFLGGGGDKEQTEIIDKQFIQSSRDSKNRNVD
ncbi:hypothetical protein JOC83_002480 [Bacillus iocasae]|uniref:Uncharacterized protein n=1 Tax=Priestia iocasae TaxID=2291674 RepID=A0ABS2QVW4_9BACI|nr:hypothetical protein [Metabacillus iocasae]